MDGLSHPALLLVDGVSSIGALDFKFDEWKVDVAVTGSQKALSLPTGLALVAVSEKVCTLQSCALFHCNPLTDLHQCKGSYVTYLIHGPACSQGNHVLLSLFHNIYC